MRVESPRSAGFRVAFRHMSSGRSSKQVVGQVLGSKGDVIVKNVMDLRTNPSGGGGTRSTSLAKREC